MKMLVKKWGNSAAVRIPASIMACIEVRAKIRSMLML